MKTQHLFTTLLALIIMVSFLPITSSANYREVVSVNVNGNVISGIDAYLDDNNHVRVSTGDDLLKIFPQELKGEIIAFDPWDGILVEEYVNIFGYESYLRLSYDNGKNFYYTFYIYTDSVGDKPGSNFPGVGFPYPEVYINGVYTPMSNIYQYWSIDFSQYQAPIFSGNRIYLNSDGHSPVEIVVDGKLVSFPDQQPIVIEPGITMVPIHTIASMLGFNVSWDAKLNCAIISQGKNTMYIYPRNTSYLFNGKYYTMTAEPLVLNGRTMVPLRFIAEAFGYTVDFQSGDVLTVSLTSQ